MLLCFGDVHLGHKHYHVLTEEKITTAEQDTRIALDQVYARAGCSDIAASVCIGDFFHSPKPNTENIRWAISWLQRMDSLQKPLYIIPGNHDIGALLTSLTFIHSLELTNVYFIENELCNLQWGKWNLHFLPFKPVSSLQNKYEGTLESLKRLISNINNDDNNIIFTHIQESASTLGAEANLFARAVEAIDFDTVFTAPLNSSSLLVSGHMHAHQIYKKQSGLTVVYPGSLTYMESIDCGLMKGYVLIDFEGNINFEPIHGIRVFNKYRLPQDKNAEEFFNEAQLSPNEVIFLDVLPETKVNENNLRFLLKERGCTLGKIKYLPKTKDLSGTGKIDIIMQENPIMQIGTYLSKYSYEVENFDWKTHIFPLGKKYIDAVFAEEDDFVN